MKREFLNLAATVCNSCPDEMISQQDGPGTFPHPRIEQHCNSKVCNSTAGTQEEVENIRTLEESGLHFGAIMKRRKIPKNNKNE